MDETIQDLEKRIAALMGELQNIRSLMASSNRTTLNADEDKRRGEITTEIRKLTDDLKKAKEDRDLIAALAVSESEADLRGGAAAGGANPAPQPSTTPGANVADKRANPRFEVVANGREHLPFRSAGEFWQSVQRAAGGDRDERHAIILSAAQKRAQASGFNITIPADGGLLVQSDVASGLLETAFQATPFGANLQRLPLSEGATVMKIPYIKDKDRTGGSVSGGFRWFSSHEAKQYEATKVDIEQMSLELKKMTGLAFTTRELERNAGALARYIEIGFRKEFSAKIARMVAYGNGTTESLGMLNPQNPALLVADKKSGQSNGTLIYENVNKMDSRFAGGEHSFWGVGRDVSEQLGLMSMPVGTGGVPVYLPANGIVGQRNGALFGNPVLKSELCKLLGQQGDIFLVDPAEYYWIDQGDMEMQTSIHVRFLFDENAYKFTYYYDGRPTWYAKLKEESGIEVSPYVVLQKRAA